MSTEIYKEAKDLPRMLLPSVQIRFGVNSENLNPVDIF